ncbi:MAG: phoB [Elusimicrobia bacterium]|nr:MAG: phoB [Elusimicrobiota bacterium]
MSTRRALIIEDDDVFANLMADWLKHLGCDSVRASDAVGGINMAAAAPPDLIILDIMLPGFGSGVDALRLIRKNPRLLSVPIIVTTAMPIKRLKLPDDDPRLWSISKSAPPAELFALIKGALWLDGTPPPTGQP